MYSQKCLLLFTQELLLETLSWVPVKTRMRFRCVSKWWCSLVFNPTFVKLHLQRSSKNTHILVTFEDQNIRQRQSMLYTRTTREPIIHSWFSPIQPQQLSLGCL
ncbi:hypothetical protein AAZV13_13G101900 [Glycine max]